MRSILNSDEMKCHLISPNFLILRNYLAGNEIFNNARGGGGGGTTFNDVVWGAGADPVNLACYIISQSRGTILLHRQIKLTVHRQLIKIDLKSKFQLLVMEEKELKFVFVSKQGEGTTFRG